jgi:hypothetical protein
MGKGPPQDIGLPRALGDGNFTNAEGTPPTLCRCCTALTASPNRALNWWRSTAAFVEMCLTRHIHQVHDTVNSHKAGLRHPAPLLSPRSGFHGHPDASNPTNRSSQPSLSDPYASRTLRNWVTAGTALASGRTAGHVYVIPKSCGGSANRC